jgi:hypothetical protein
LDDLRLGEVPLAGHKSGATIGPQIDYRVGPGVRQAMLCERGNRGDECNDDSETGFMGQLTFTT